MIPFKWPKIKTGDKFTRRSKSFNLIRSHVNMKRSLGIFQVIPDEQRIQEMTKQYNEVSHKKVGYRPMRDANKEIIGYEIYPL